MSMEPNPKPETPRTGKYCPRCHAMAPRDQALCRQCGHQFRTGTDRMGTDRMGTDRMGTDAPGPETAAPDPLHRTMQFVLPPLPSRVPAPVQTAPEPGERLKIRAAPPQAVLEFGRRHRAAAALAALLVCLGAAWLWHSRASFAPSGTSPVGVWETTLHGKASANAHLEFQFSAGGTGAFSWQESGPAAPSGQTPLRWHQNPDGTLNLALTPPPGGDPVSQILTSIFSRPAWPWRVDRAQGRLVLGTLVFTEKP